MANRQTIRRGKRQFPRTPLEARRTAVIAASVAGLVAAGRGIAYPQSADVATASTLVLSS